MFVEQNHQIAEHHESAGSHHKGENAVSGDELPSKDGAAAEDLADDSYDGEGHRETEADPEAVESGVEGIVLVGICLGTSEDYTVDDDQRDEESECGIYVRDECLHEELQGGHEGRYHHDIDRDVHLVRDYRSDKGDEDV